MAPSAPGSRRPRSRGTRRGLQPAVPGAPGAQPCLTRERGAMRRGGAASAATACAPLARLALPWVPSHLVPLSCRRHRPPWPRECLRRASLPVLCVQSFSSSRVPPQQPPPLGSIFSALGGAESAQGVVPPHLCPQLVPELGDPNRQQSEGHGGGRWGHRGENLLPNSQGPAGRTGVLTAGPCQGHAPRSWTFCLGHGCEARPVRPNSA